MILGYSFLTKTTFDKTLKFIIILSVIVEVKVVGFPVSIATILHRRELCMMLTQIIFMVLRGTINPIIAHFWSVRRHKEIRRLLQLSTFNKLLLVSSVLILHNLFRILLWNILGIALLDILMLGRLLRLLVEVLLGRSSLWHSRLVLLRELLV